MPPLARQPKEWEAQRFSTVQDLDSAAGSPVQTNFLRPTTQPPRRYLDSYKSRYIIPGKLSSHLPPDSHHGFSGKLGAVERVVLCQNG
jgi:hypothetical protein